MEITLLANSTQLSIDQEETLSAIEQACIGGKGKRDILSMSLVVSMIFHTVKMRH